MIDIDEQLLSGIRALPSFSFGCDLASLANHYSRPAELLQRLVSEQVLSKQDAGLFWSRQLGVAYVDLDMTVVSDAALEKLHAVVARKACALPLYQLGESVTVAMAHPEDYALVQRLSNIMQQPVSPVFAFPSELDAMVGLKYATGESLEQALGSVGKSSTFESGVDLSQGSRDLARLAESEEVVGFVETLVHYAIRSRASDIHIEPRETDARVRLRIDGNLREVLVLPPRIFPAVVSRFKIMCKLDIVESRYPADGRFSLSLGSSSQDFRFSSIPTQYGEKVVVRVLGNAGRQSLLTLDQMMVSQTVLKPLRRVLKSPSGMVFVTGPTGSGKTTTLYSALAELNDSTVNISTIEDPIELRLEGINQTQVQHHIQRGFAMMLRSLLRQDPDVILVGEIRDLETAKIAAEAALTGHLVLASLHTNSAPEAVVRLQEMGVDPCLVAPSVNAVLAQRLAAKICPHCKESYIPSEDVLRRYFNDEKLPPVRFYRGRGCQACDNTGYHGRVAFHELFLVNKPMRSLMSKGADVQALVSLAESIGYKPLRYDALKKVVLGLTTIEQVEALTAVEFEG